MRSRASSVGSIAPAPARWPGAGRRAPSNAGSSVREVGAEVARRGSRVRASALSATAATADAASARRSSPAASRTRPASSPERSASSGVTASNRSRGAGSGRPRGQTARQRGECCPVRRRGTRATSSTRAGSRRARRCRRTRRPRTGRVLGAAVEVGDDAAHRVVRGRRDRDRLVGRVEPALSSAAISVGKRPRSTGRRSSSAVPRASIARATTSRGASSSVKRSPCSSSSSAPSPRSASREQEADGPTSAVGWNCTNSRSATAAPARYASAIPSPTAPARVRRPLPERRRRRRSRAASPRAGIARRRSEAEAATSSVQSRRALTLDDVDARMVEHALQQDTRDLACPSPHHRRGHTGTRMAALEAELASNSTPRSTRSTILACCLFGEDAYSRLAAEPAPGAQRVCSACSSGESSGLGGGGNAALREPARGLVRTGAFREDEDARFRRPRTRAPERPATPLPTTIRSYSCPISGKFSTQS